MTDNEKMKLDGKALGALNLEDEPLVSAEDDLLLQSFFAEFKEDIPDNGFSERVMRQIPDTSHQRLARWWQVACVVVGVAFLCSGSVWGSLQDFLFTSKIDFMIQSSRVACSLVEAMGQSHTWLMMLAGMVTVACVWGYNELQEYSS